MPHSWRQGAKKNNNTRISTYGAELACRVSDGLASSTYVGWLAFDFFKTFLLITAQTTEIPHLEKPPWQT